MGNKYFKRVYKKGFVLNSELLKNGPKFGKDYFDELLVKIKEIRASERRFYQKITDIYKECSYDYDKNSRDYVTKEKQNTFMNPNEVARTICDNIFTNLNLNVADINIERN